MGGRCFGFLLKCLIFLALLYGYAEVRAHCKVQIFVEMIFGVHSFLCSLGWSQNAYFRIFYPLKNETHLKIFKEPQPSWN